MRDARRKDLAFEPIPCVEESGRVGALTRSSPTRRRETGEGLAWEIEAIREEP
jgi:hypothetical protein